MLPIIGFQGTSLIEFPGKISSIVFLGGCNLRCPYCQNGSLFEFNPEETMPQDALLETLDKRRKLIDGVVFSGGEPTLYPDLIGLIRMINRDLGILVKLDTNGLNPEFIEEALPYLAFCAVDMKTLPERYKDLGSTIDGKETRKRLLRTRDLLDKSPLQLEYRTTMYPPVVDSYETLYQMMEFVPARADYYLQRFIPGNAWDIAAQKVETFAPEQIERIALELRRNLNREKIFLRTYT